MPDRAAWNGYVEQGRFGSAHRSGWHAALCDGSVRFVSYDLDSETHRRLGNRADGSSTPPHEY